MRHRKSNGMRSRRDDEESRPSISASGPTQRAVMLTDPNLLTISHPMSAGEESRSSNYKVVQRMAPKKAKKRESN